jgi:DNA (cytosine-5)-methyltransferase 1
LDLFSGAGGAAMGYHRAGFDVVGVDLASQPRYPFEFHQGDAMTWPLGGFDVVHASPPCQRYSTATPDRSAHPDLYGPTRDRLEASGVPWVIENVIGAPYRCGLVLCGSMFGLRVRRHRLFETSHLMLAPTCDHRSQGTPLGVYGNGGGGDYPGHNGTKAHRRHFGELMDMEWATPSEVVQAIPPSYTEWIGARLLAALEAAA